MGEVDKNPDPQWQLINAQQTEITQLRADVEEIGNIATIIHAKDTAKITRLQAALEDTTECLTDISELTTDKGAKLMAKNGAKIGEQALKGQDDG